MKKPLTKVQREIKAKQLSRFFREVIDAQDAREKIYWDNVYSRVQFILKELP